MYFHVLRELSVSEFYDRLLYLIYKNNYHRRFSPKIYKYFEDLLNEDEWLSVLERLTEHELLKINYELCCPLTGGTIKIFDEYDQIPLDSEEMCGDCGEVFTVTNSDIYITYNFRSGFTPDEKKDDDSTIRDKTFNGENGVGRGFTLDDYKNYPERVFETIIRERRDEINSIIKKIRDASDTTSKGRLFEDLSEKLLTSPYMKVACRDYRYSTGEIDLAFNVKKYESTLFQSFPDLIIVECKNWNKKVGASEIRVFASKMAFVKTTIGFFMSKNGITGNDDHVRDATGIVKEEHGKGNIIILMKCDDIENILSKKLNLYKLLEKKYFKARIP